MDHLVLARIQFAANITFHILFPAISISLGWILLFFKLRFSKTKDKKWIDSYKLWVKVFALCFAIGVVSGVTMSFQFGTNWPGFMRTVGNIAGPLLAYEVLTAFFLEATFLAVMLFGMNRVSDRLHNIATFLVAFGTTVSAFWILVLNSWMQTPSGFEMINGQAHVTNWVEVIFNPSMPYRITHMLLASGLTTAFLIAGVSAYQYLKNNKSAAVLASLKTGVYLAAILIPVQIFVGDAHGLNTLKHQPAKIAAMEGVWHSEKGAPLLLFAIPDQKNKTNHFEIAIPKLASIILTHDSNGEIKGLNEFENNHPPVAPVFYSFRIMVGVGLLMLVVSWVASFMIYKNKNIGKFMAKVLVFMTFSGWIALVSGWYATEIGRQPYLVYGILKTVDAATSSSVVSSKMIITTLLMYLSVYVLLIISFVAVLFHLAKKASNEKNHDLIIK